MRGMSKIWILKPMLTTQKHPATKDMHGVEQFRYCTVMLKGFRLLWNLNLILIVKECNGNKYKWSIFSSNSWTK